VLGSVLRLGRASVFQRFMWQ